MNTVTIRDLRNNSAAVLARVAHGEHLTVTKDGSPAAEIIPIRRTPLNAEQLVARFKNLPPLDGAALRHDLDQILDPTL